MWDKRTDKVPNIYLSLDFANKTPSLSSPPLENPKLNGVFTVVNLYVISLTLFV